MPPCILTNSRTKVLLRFRLSEAMYAKVDRNERAKVSESFFAHDYLFLSRRRSWLDCNQTDSEMAVWQPNSVIPTKRLD
jgi:hypothetical protein